MGVDLDEPFGGDIGLGTQPDVGVLGLSTHDVGFLVDRDELIQRVVRRLLTNPGEWIPFPEYGAGLRQRVNEPLTPQTVADIRATIVNQVLLEPDVARDPLPKVQIQAVPNGVLVTLVFYQLDLTPVSFSFNALNTNQLTPPAIRTGS